jgi:peptidoglycan/LPS O-acetylase OafA/YrhL
MVAPHSEQKGHMPELDGIRGLAILGVLCSHIAVLGGIISAELPSLPERLLLYAMVPMWGGVDLFFVLSGFLITGILLRTKTSNNYFSSFYTRRVLRIFPIYYLTLILSLIVGRFSVDMASMLPPWTSWKLSYFLYLQNWPIFWHGAKGMGGFWGAYWSLAVEEQFYFVWPLVILLLSEKAIVRICYIALPCALLLRIFLYFIYFDNQVGLVQITSSRVDGLFMGAICSIYMFLRKRPVPMGSIIVCGSAGSAILGYIAIFHRYELVSRALWMGTIGITGYALLSTALVAISQHKLPFVQKVLTLKWMLLAGKYSYGMYVYHIFIIFAIRHYLVSFSSLRLDLGVRFGFPVIILAIIIEMVVVYLVAKVSYDLYEARFLRLKKYFKPK